MADGASSVYRVHRLTAAEPLVAPPPARQLSGVATPYNNETPIRPAIPFGNSGASPYHGFADNKTRGGKQWKKYVHFGRLSVFQVATGLYEDLRA